MAHKKKTYRVLATVVLVPTLIWYVTLFFTGTHSPRATVFMAIGVTGLFALSALLYGLGEMIKTALGTLFMACTGVLVLFLAAGFMEAPGL